MSGFVFVFVALLACAAYYFTSIDKGVNDQNPYLYRPAGIRVTNDICKRYNWSLAPSLNNADSLLDEVMSSTGLRDLGPNEQEFMENYYALVDSFHAEAKLHAIGEAVVHGILSAGIKQRLEIVDYLKKNRAVVEEQEIRAPLIIYGLPRTGTTFMHSLLAQDDAMFRAPMHYEMQRPIPPVKETARKDWNLRQTLCDVNLAMFKAMAPDIVTKHDLGAMEPEECVVVFGQTFFSAHFPTIFYVPSYAERILSDEKGHGIAMEWHKTFLQVLQSGDGIDRPEKRRKWLLKTPAYLGFIDDLLRAYPDAMLIHTHREPMSVARSLTSLMASYVGIVSDDLSPQEIGDLGVKFWAGMLKRGRGKGAIEPRNYFDVQFEDLVKDPIAVVEKIYKHFNLVLTSKVKAKMRAFANRNRQGSKGKHVVHENIIQLDERFILEHLTDP